MDRREYSLEWWDSIDENRMIATVDFEGEGEETEVPIKYEVCGVCNGKGSHVNPSIDSHGISAEEWSEEWDEEEREMYVSGGYDVPCVECEGKRVVAAIDEERADPEVIKKVEEKIQDKLDYMAEVAAERRMMGY